MSNTPRIYVACLASYNNAILFGEWIDCDQDVDEIYSEIQQMLADSPEPDAKEWAIHDYDNWHGIEIREHESIELLAQLGQAIAKHGAAVAHYWTEFGELEGFEDRYVGCWNTELDYVEYFLEETGTLKAWEEIGLDIDYIDIEAIARDWFTNSLISVNDFDGDQYVVYVFSRR